MEKAISVQQWYLNIVKLQGSSTSLGVSKMRQDGLKKPIIHFFPINILHLKMQAR